MWEGLARFGVMPSWLAALDDDDVVQSALAKVVPGLRRAKLGGMRLKDKAWTARCSLALDGVESTVQLAGTIVPPGEREPANAAAPVGLPGSDGWRCWLPELRLELVSKAEPEAELPALELLTDPDRARTLLEVSIREGAPAYGDLQIAAVTPKVMRYSPGSRCTVLYRLEFPDVPQARDWPDVVVAKTYSRSDKGTVAWDGMRALWRSPMARSGVVTVAEPLAWLPEPRILVQGPIPEERTLKELLLTTYPSDSGQSQDELWNYLDKTAAGLVELHHCGVTPTVLATWEEELAEVCQVLGRLTAVLPQLDGAADPFLEDLEQLAGRISPDDVLPAHRSFRPAQVLLHKGGIGFIDFDGFCRAEPALDVALFRATAKDLVMSALPRSAPLEEQLRIADEVCERFLHSYESRASISRERVALWEALDLFTNVLHSWTKVSPYRLAYSLPLLQHHADGLQTLMSQL